MSGLTGAVIIQTVAYLSAQYRQVVQLRHEVLRAPLGQTFSAGFLARDTDNIIIAAFIQDELTGCCQLEAGTNGTYQLRQMAVAPAWQGGGTGTQLIRFAENQVLQCGGTRITLHAREVAAPFYRKLGYTAIGDPFTEIGLPHLEMGKDL